MIFTVEKGKHYFAPKLFRLFWKRKSIAFSVMFTDSCLYELPKENYGQWNKVIGISDLNSHHSQNSVRLGWRGDIDGIELCLYVRKNGAWEAISFGKFQTDTRYSCKLGFNKYSYYLTIDDTTKYTGRFSRKKWGFNYLLSPYFGGRYSAPQQIKLFVDV